MDFLNTLLDEIGRLFAIASPPLAFIRAGLGLVLVFFLPGFAWSLVFFRRINVIERIALSLGLSIALVTLSILFTNVVLRIKITIASSLMTILIIIGVPLVVYFITRLARKHEPPSS